MSMKAFHSELHSYGTFLRLLIIQAIHLPHMCGQLRITNLINMDFSGQWDSGKYAPSTWKGLIQPPDSNIPVVRGPC